MAYEKTIWEAGMLVTSSLMNKIEQGIADAAGLPSVNSSNEGAILQVVNGAWAAVQLPIAEEAMF